MRVQARTKQIIDLLLVHPRMGVRTDDPAIRRVTTSPYPYLLFYEVTETEIIIHAARHAARSIWDAWRLVGAAITAPRTSPWTSDQFEPERSAQDLGRALKRRNRDIAGT
jgi:hypothetical protein